MTTHTTKHYVLLSYSISLIWPYLLGHLKREYFQNLVGRYLLYIVDTFHNTVIPVNESVPLRARYVSLPYYRRPQLTDSIGWIMSLPSS